MYDILANHLITILLRSDINGPRDRIISEEGKFSHHVDAIKSIEKTLNHKYRIPYISREVTSLIDTIQAHLEFGNTIVYNMSTNEKMMFMVYIPQYINELDKDIIRGFVKELRGADTLFIYQKDGINHKNIPVDEFLQTKAKRFTLGRQNKKNNK